MDGFPCRCERGLRTEWNEMERNRTIDGAISKRRRPPINRVLLVHEPAALADLRPATVNQCFYEHSLAGTASLQPRLTEPTPATHSGSPLSCIRPDTHHSSSPPPIRTDSHRFASRDAFYLRDPLPFPRAIGYYIFHGTHSQRSLSPSRCEKKRNSRSPRKRGCLDNLLSLRINIRFAVH